MLMILAGLAAIAAAIALGAVLALAWRVVPAARSDVASPLGALLWALYGNDDGGLYGERDAWGMFLLPEEMTAATALRWWLRNPLHNLFWHVLAWPADRAFVLFDAPAGGFCYYRRPRQWLGLGNQAQVTLAPPFAACRLGRFEAYLGFRDHDGRLGFACRLTSRPY
jgi:hypothetical protein